MKTGKLWKALILAGIVGIAGGLAGCGGEKADKGASAAVSSNGKKIVKIAHTAHYFPYDYVDDKNQSDGMEVAVMKEVAKKLPRYEFQYVPTSDDDLLIGVESGKYDAGTKGIWKTPAREKKYIFPENNIAASVIGVTIRSEDADKIHSLEDFAKAGKKLVPIAPQNAQYQVIKDFNTAHPDSPINLEASENFQVADAYSWVLEGRYDGYLSIGLAYKKNVTAPDAPYKDYKNKLTYIRYKALPTYVLVNKNDKELARQINQALGELKKEGKIAELEKQYFGEEISPLLDQK